MFTIKEISGQFLWKVIQSCMKQGFIFFIFILSAKLLNVYNFGIYSYLFSFVSLLTLFSDFGVSTATSKYVAQHHTDNSVDFTRDIPFNSFLIISVFGIPISLLIFIFGVDYFGSEYQYVLLLIPLIFLVPLTSIYDAIFRGLKKFKRSAFVSISAAIISLCAAVPLMLFYKILGSIVALDLFYFIFAVTYVFQFGRHHITLSKRVVKDISQYSLVYGVAVVGYQIFAKTDVLFLGHYGYIEQIATYQLINTIFTVLLVPFILAGQVIAPYFTELFYIKKDYSLINLLFKQYSYILLGISVLGGVFLYFLFPIFWKLFFSEYPIAIFMQVFPIALLIFLLNIFVSTVDHGIIIPTGYAKIMSISYTALAILNVILNLFLIRINYLGSLYATLICTLLMVLALRILYIREVRKLLA